MTREEAIKIIDMGKKFAYDEKYVEAFDMAIDALEQELKIPNALDFAISASDGDTNYFVGFRNGLRYAKSLIDRRDPSYESCTKQEPKTGHWIEHDCESLSRMGYYRCSECNHGYQRYERGVRKSEVPYIDGQKYELHRIANFCPNCGAKMESEVKEC